MCRILVGRSRNLFDTFVTGAMLRIFQESGDLIYQGVRQARGLGYVDSIIILVPEGAQGYGGGLMVLATEQGSLLTQPEIMTYPISLDSNSPDYWKAWTIRANLVSQRLELSEPDPGPSNGIPSVG